MGKGQCWINLCQTFATLNRKTKKRETLMAEWAGRFFSFLCVWFFLKNLSFMIQNKVRWNSFGLYTWAMCMAFPWAALCCHIKIWHQCVFGRRGIVVRFTQFARWKGHFQNKPFLVCHSHTPTQSAAPHWAPSDNVAAIVLSVLSFVRIDSWSLISTAEQLSQR